MTSNTTRCVYTLDVPDGYNWFLWNESQKCVNFLSSKDIVSLVRSNIKEIKENNSDLSSHVRKMLDEIDYDIVTPGEAMMVIQDLFDCGDNLFRIKEGAKKIYIEPSKKALKVRFR